MYFFEESTAKTMSRESIVLTVIGTLLSVIALESATGVDGALGTYATLLVLVLTIVLPLYLGYQIFEGLEEQRAEQ